MPDHTSSAATRQDLYVVREWLRRADRDSEPFAGRIMKPDVREALRRIIENIEEERGAAA